jgi:hypothetical protein
MGMRQGDSGGSTEDADPDDKYKMPVPAQRYIRTSTATILAVRQHNNAPHGWPHLVKHRP